jgi:hypothetical protein
MREGWEAKLYDNLNTYHMGAQDLRWPWPAREGTHLGYQFQVVMFAPQL